jgi:replication factor A1
MATPNPPEPPAEVRLRDLSPTGAPVEVIGRIVTLERRDVARRTDGARRSLLAGLLSDGTATVRFTWWDPPREGIERGEIVRAVGAEVREFRGRPELVFSWKTRIGPAGEAELPRIDPEELPLRSVRELRSPIEGFRLEARVVRTAPRSVSVGEDQRVLHEGLLADGTGAIAFTSWSDFGLGAGEAVRIVGAYVRVFRGRPQLVLDERATVVRIEGVGLPEPAQVLRAPPRLLGDLETESSAEAVAVEGMVVHVMPPSGLVFRCPTCRRLVSGGLCRVHGEVSGVADLRARLVLDDGTGTVVVATDRETTERLWNVTLEEVRRRLRVQPDPTLLEESLAEALVGRRLRARGSVVRDEWGLRLTPESIEATEVDLDTAAEELARRLPGAAP